jgi:antiviral defense system Shedu protein SduA
LLWGGDALNLSRVSKQAANSRDRIDRTMDLLKMTDTDKFSKILIHPGKPVQFLEPESAEIPTKIPEGGQQADQFRATIKAYLGALQELLRGKYAGIREFVPNYLADPGSVLGVCCSDGVVLRFDPKSGERRTFVGRTSESLSVVATQISEGVVRCHKSHDFEPGIGVTVQIQVSSETGEVKHQTEKKNVCIDVVLERPGNLPTPPQKPFCLTSVENNWEMLMFGEEMSVDDQSKRSFIARAPFRIDAIGWDCIQVYPFSSEENWRPEYGPVWAEMDLLATVMVRQSRERHFASLDPHAEARAKKIQMLSKFEELLNSNPQREEVLQQFLKEHPEMLCPTYARCHPKLALGAHVTDFVFGEANGDYLLVELEKSIARPFLKGKKATDPSTDLNHARSQVTDWRRYLQDNLKTVEIELGLTGISSNPRSLIVIGRSAMLNTKQRQKLIAMENESPRSKIMTYDDVLHNARVSIENVLGPLGRKWGNASLYFSEKMA